MLCFLAYYARVKLDGAHILVIALEGGVSAVQYQGEGNFIDHVSDDDFESGCVRLGGGIRHLNDYLGLPLPTGRGGDVDGVTGIKGDPGAGIGAVGDSERQFADSVVWIVDISTKVNGVFPRFIHEQQLRRDGHEGGH